MNSERISTIAVEPFISKFVFAIIKSIQDKNFPHEEKHVIHSDLVPKVSEKVMQASLGEKIRAGSSTTVVLPKRDMNKPVAPVTQPKIIRPRLPQNVPRRIPPRRMIQPPQKAARQNIPPEKQVKPTQEYGKITPLLNDPSVSTIECQGEGKAVMIIRAGQRQVTKINLSAGDIKEILEKVSDATHIPILEGVFRATVDNFFINAVISEMIGSRFVIRKQMTHSAFRR